MLIRRFLLSGALALFIASPAAAQLADDNNLNTVVVRKTLPTPQGALTIGSQGPNPWIGFHDRRGKPVWRQRFTQHEYGYFDDAALAGDGGFLGAGSSNLMMGPAIVTRLSPDGVILWEQSVDGESYNAAAIDATEDGGAVAVGGASTGAQSARWAVRLDPMGKIVWRRDFDSPDSKGKASAILSLPDGGFLIAGEHWTTCACEGYRGGEPWAARLNGAGETIWEKTFPDLTFTEINGEGADFRVSSARAETANQFRVAGEVEKFKDSAALRLGRWEMILDGAGNVITQKFAKE